MYIKEVRKINYSSYFAVLFALLISSYLVASMPHFPPSVMAQTIATKFPLNISKISTAFLTYQNPVLGITIEYPSEWKKIEGNNIVGFFSFGRAQVYLLILNSTLNYSLDKYSNLTLNIFENTKPDFHLNESGPALLAGINANYITYTYRNPQYGLLNEKDILFVKGDKAYQIAYFANPKYYTSYLPIAQKMIDSFQIHAPLQNLLTHQNSTTVTSSLWTSYR